jgi:peptidyl-prolyl cis-trans isomerase SurA
VQHRAVRLVPLWLCLVSLSAHADAVLVDRIVAVVDTHPITRSAVEERARPLLAVAKTDAEKAQVRREVLIELIQDSLIQKETRRLGLEVRDEEVDAALAEIARQNQLTVAELIVETKRQGLDGDRYKAMLRRQLLEYKWLSLRSNRAAMPVLDSDRGAFLAKEKTRLLEELRAAAIIEVRP